MLSSPTTSSSPPPPSSSSSSKQEKEEDVNNRFRRYASEYNVELQWPPIVETMASSEEESTTLRNKAKLKTNNEFIFHRLWESGVLSEVPVPLGETIISLNRFVQDLERTGCYHDVSVELMESPKQQQQQQQNYNNDKQQQQQQVGHPVQLKILLEEKNWYRLHVGGAVKANELFQGNTSILGGANSSSLPSGAAEVEFTTGLRNLTGTCDTTNLSYVVDTSGTPSYSLTHEQPLYNLFWPHIFLLWNNGSQISFLCRSFCNTLDYEWTRSYKEYQRGFLARIANRYHAPLVVERAPPGFFWALTYQAILRDIIPKPQQQPNGGMLYDCDASPAIVLQSGHPTLKHSILAEFRQNGSLLDQAQLPTRGIDWNISAELANSSDVAFGKYQANLAFHWPLMAMFFSHTPTPPPQQNQQHDSSSSWTNNDNNIGGSDEYNDQDGLVLHTLFNVGYLHSFGRGRYPTVSDRFFVGGPMNFRGFLSAGVGPRAKKSTNASDSLGGDFYYTLTAMASLPMTTATTTPFRAFGFGTIGTCVGSLPYVVASSSSSSSLPSQQLYWPWMGNAVGTMDALYQSSRISVGVGVATQVLGSRLELTWSCPIRFGPMDHRRNFQIGLSAALDR